MKFTKIALTLLCSIVIFCGCSKDSDVVLKINDTQITKGEFYGDLDKLINVRLKNVPAELKANDSLPRLSIKKEYTNDVIVRELLRQEFTRRKITVSEKEFNDKKAEFVAKIGSEELFYNKLREYGVSDEKLKKDLEDEICIEKLVKTFAQPKVTNAEIQKMYNENKQQFVYPQRVRVSHILIDTNLSTVKRMIADSDKEAKLSQSEIEEKAKAEVARKEKLIVDLRQQLVKNPKKFAQLAQEYSEDTASARQGGDIGYIVKEQVVPEFGQAAFSQKVGAIGPIIKTQFGKHIVLVTDKSAGGMQTFADVKADLKAYLLEQKKHEAFDKFVKGLKDKSKIEYVDKTLSPEYFEKEMEVAISKYQKFEKMQRAPKSKKKILDKIEQEQKAKKEAEKKKEEKK